jgi:hypothetical protein
MPMDDAVAAFSAGAAALADADVDGPALREVLGHYESLHVGFRRVEMVGYAMLARLDREAGTGDLRATSLRHALMLRLQMSKGQAMKRIARARKLVGTRTFQGEVLPAEWEHTAAAYARGEIGDEHVEVIRKFFAALPSRVDPVTRSQAEKTLADVAVDQDPRGLTIAAMHLLARLHPDGEAPAEEVARKVGLTLGPQQPDGTRYIRGWVSPRLGAFLEPIVAKFGERRRHRTPGEPEHDPATPEPTTNTEADVEVDPTIEEPTLFDEPESEPDPEPEQTQDAEGVVVEDNPFAPHPDDPPLPTIGPLTDDLGRSKSQYLHDAVEAAFDLLLRSGTLGTLNGLPTTVVVTTTLQESGARSGLRRHRRRVPVADAGSHRDGGPRRLSLPRSIRRPHRGDPALRTRQTLRHRSSEARPVRP